MSDQTQQPEQRAEDWAAAELRGDTAFLGEVLADDFIAVGPRGFTLTKEQWVSRHEAGNLRYESFGLDEVEVRPYGDAADPELQGPDGVHPSLAGQKAIARAFVERMTP